VARAVAFAAHFVVPDLDAFSTSQMTSVTKAELQQLINVKLDMLNMKGAELQAHKAKQQGELKAHRSEFRSAEDVLRNNMDDKLSNLEVLETQIGDITIDMEANSRAVREMVLVRDTVAELCFEVLVVRSQSAESQDVKESVGKRQKVSIGCVATCLGSAAASVGLWELVRAAVLQPFGGAIAGLIVETVMELHKSVTGAFSESVSGAAAAACSLMN
jgi:hypothetical protein